MKEFEGTLGDFFDKYGKKKNRGKLKKGAYINEHHPWPLDQGQLDILFKTLPSGLHIKVWIK